MGRKCGDDISLSELLPFCEYSKIRTGFRSTISLSWDDLENLRSAGSWETQRLMSEEAEVSQCQQG